MAIQPNPSYDMLLMSSQRSFMPKKRKGYWSVSEIGTSPHPLKVDADAADDDGRVGIWKAPLPDGTAELKIDSLWTGIKKFSDLSYVWDVSLTCHII